MGLLRRTTGTRAEYFADILAPHVADGSDVLDLGCGDLSIAEALAARCRNVRILGIDVLEPARTDGGPFVTFRKYDGRTVPLPDRSVDTTYLAFVLHHTDDADQVLREVVRVTRRNVVLLEDVYTNPVDKLLLKLFDAGNLLQAPEMRVPFNFRTEREWLRALQALPVADIESIPIRPVVRKPTRHRKFVATVAAAGV